MNITSTLVKAKRSKKNKEQLTNRNATQHTENHYLQLGNLQPINKFSENEKISVLHTN